MSRVRAPRLQVHSRKIGNLDARSVGAGSNGACDSKLRARRKIAERATLTEELGNLGVRGASLNRDRAWPAVCWWLKVKDAIEVPESYQCAPMTLDDGRERMAAANHTHRCFSHLDLLLELSYCGGLPHRRGTKDDVAVPVVLEELLVAAYAARQRASSGAQRAHDPKERLPRRGAGHFCHIILRFTRTPDARSA